MECVKKKCKFAVTCPPKLWYTCPACRKSWCDQHQNDAKALKIVRYRRKLSPDERDAGKDIVFEGKRMLIGVTEEQFVYCTVCGGPLCKYCVLEPLLFGKPKCAKCGRPVVTKLL